MPGLLSIKLELHMVDIDDVFRLCILLWLDNRLISRFYHGKRHILAVCYNVCHFRRRQAR